MHRVVFYPQCVVKVKASTKNAAGPGFKSGQNLSSDLKTGILVATLQTPDVKALCQDGLPGCQNAVAR